jgi:hypothetical protein
MQQTFLLVKEYLVSLLFLPSIYVCLKGPTNIKIFINNFFLILAIKEQHILDTYAGKQLS